MKKQSKCFFLMCVLLLASCNWEGSRQSKTYLHYSGTLMACRDIHGADLLSSVNFGAYPGEDYNSHFDCNKSTLTLGVGMQETGTCYGFGQINIFSADGIDAIIERDFTYFATPTDLSAARISSSLETEGIIGHMSFVYINATWSRITIPVLIDKRTVDVTFQFWSTRDIGYPNVFDGFNKSN